MQKTLSPQSLNGNGTFKNGTGTMRVDVLNLADSNASSSKFGAIFDLALSDIFNKALVVSLETLHVKDPRKNI